MSHLVNMCPDALEQASNMVLLIAVGSVEYHGSQLPLGTDLFITQGVAEAVEQRLPNQVAVAPPIAISPTGFAVSGPERGTVDIDVDCFMRYCGELLSSYERMSFKKIIVLVHHQGGNIISMLKTVISKHFMYDVKNERGNTWWSDKILASYRKTPVDVIPAMLDTHYFGGHGGKGETEAILAMKPELVHMENIVDLKHEYFWNQTVMEADKEKADAEFNELINKWVTFIEEI